MNEMPTQALGASASKADIAAKVEEIKTEQYDESSTWPFGDSLVVPGDGDADGIGRERQAGAIKAELIDGGRIAAERLAYRIDRTDTREGGGDSACARGPDVNGIGSTRIGGSRRRWDCPTCRGRWR